MLEIRVTDPGLDQDLLHRAMARGGVLKRCEEAQREALGEGTEDAFAAAMPEERVRIALDRLVAHEAQKSAWIDDVDG